MRYRSFPPGPALAPLVECFWSLEDDASGPAPRAPEAVWPDGCLELIVHLGRPFRAWGDAGAFAPQPVSFLVGQLTGPMVLQAQGPVATFGVRFRPAGARPFFGMPLDRLAGRSVGLDTLWEAHAARFEAALADAPAGRARARVAEGVLLERLDRRRLPPPEVRVAVARIVSARGALRVDRVARDVGWGPRRLERGFDADVGVGPKAFARLVRFQALLERLPSREPDWVALALDCGFFDQSHLAGEVRSLAGVTPSTLAAGRDRLAAVFTSRERLAAYFAG